MSKEQNIENKDKALHIGRVIISLPLRERIELIYNSTKKATEKRKNQGFPMTYKKRQMYEMGFQDAIEWILGNKL
jgi:CRISPR/Cas system-associated endonuclease/helicase Cas3